MIQDVLAALVVVSLRDRVFVIIATATLALLVLSVGLALTVIGLRLRLDRRHRGWSALVTELEPVVLDVLAGDRPPEDVWQLVKPRDRLQFIEFLLYQYAYKVTGLELAALRELAKPYLGLISRHVADSSSEVRANSFQALAILGPTDYRELVVQALNDPSPAVALVAARALAHTGGAEHLGEILDHLDRFELWSSGFLSVLIASMGPEAIPELAAKYRDHSALPEARAMCGDAIRIIGPADAADLAAEVLEGLGHPLEPTEASESVGAVSPPASVPGGEVTKIGDEREVRLSALRILAELGHAGHLPLVRALILDADPVVRAYVVTALGEIGDPSDVARLVSAFDDPSRWVAVHAAQSLRAMKAFDVINALAQTHPIRSDLALEVSAG